MFITFCKYFTTLIKPYGKRPIFATSFLEKLKKKRDERIIYNKTSIIPFQILVVCTNF